VLLHLPPEIHRRAKAAAALAGYGWDEVAIEAFEQWTRVRMAQERGR
jgi:hypothetical protein